MSTIARMKCYSQGTCLRARYLFKFWEINDNILRTHCILSCINKKLSYHTGTLSCSVSQYLYKCSSTVQKSLRRACTWIETIYKV